ncbi:sulfatase [uncultured Aquimarina sp.]|uniref:sulfatase n=1 Tax=uncultured Aquimarina sp. TaxID=575652 RepID=UPI00263431E7|nr:sulfatase [uncultured Aquimarina sp.]
MVISVNNYKKILCFCLGLICIWSCKNDNNKTNDSKQNVNTNIIMIVADDLGWYDLSCYGNDFIETQNLDRLAKEGIRFTDAYAAAPLCSPSRASLITGLHPIRVNITEHIHGNHPPGPNQKLKTPPVAQQLRPQYKTIAEALKIKDYNTAFIGKWHLGGGKFTPDNRGFDVNIAGAWNGLPKSFFYPFFNKGEKPELQNSSKEGDYLTDVLTTKAIEYLEQQKDSSFFLSLNYYSPHVPIEAKPNLVEKYRNKRGNDTSEATMPNIHYAAMVESIDQNVGRILNKLKELNLEENTLVLFTSDNGGLSVREVPAFAKHTPPTDNGKLREGKGYVYEGGIREPLIIRWPRMIQPGQENNVPVIAQDFFNTFMEITNSKERTQDGQSLLPLFKNEEVLKRGLLWHLPHYSPQHGKPSTAYREGDWKLIHFYEDDNYELYNLKEDLSEENNLVESQMEIFHTLKVNMNKMLINMNAKLPKPNPNYIEK